MLSVNNGDESDSGLKCSVSLRTLNYGDSSFIKYIHRFLVLRTSSEASPPSSKKYHVVLKWLETSCDPVNPQTPRLHTEPTYGFTVSLLNMNSV